MLLCARAVDTLGMMPCMVILTKERICVDCCCRFVAANGKASVRCKPCQRLFVRREARDRDNARYARQRAQPAICSAIGVHKCDVLRDNGHRCQCCRRVLFLDAGRASHVCHECRPLSDAADTVIGVLAFIFSAAVFGLRECCVCSQGVPAWSSAKTCSESCAAEVNRRKGRERYERLNGVRLRPLSEPRQCRLCDAFIGVTNARGCGRSICDTCNTYRGDFKSRARKYGVQYTEFDKRDVFARDAWRCQLCKRAVLKTAKRDKRTRRLHPRTASLDHIVPLSKGGPHVESNVQCACLECNVRKQARRIGQLRIF